MHQNGDGIITAKQGTGAKQMTRVMRAQNGDDANMGDPYYPRMIRSTPEMVYPAKQGRGSQQMTRAMRAQNEDDANMGDPYYLRLIRSISEMVYQYFLRSN